MTKHVFVGMFCLNFRSNYQEDNGLDVYLLVENGCGVVMWDATIFVVFV